MRYLARKLREIGMDQVEAVNDAVVPICKSRDPKYNIYCDINTINLLGIENTRLIIQYIHLDARVGPFLFTLKLFIKSKEINNCKYSVSAAIWYPSLTHCILARKGYVSSYAFILMGLHFLMFVQKPALIPCLQNLKDATCLSPNCNFSRRTCVDGCNVRYHDCVLVENSVT